MVQKTQKSLTDLFDQLGLASGEDEIQHFLKSHTIADDLPLEEAPFWNASQAAFLKEARSEDADWAIAVDELSEHLRSE